MAVDQKYQKEMLEAIAKQPKLSVLDLGIWLAATVVSWSGTSGLSYLLFARIGMYRDGAVDAVAVTETGAIFWGLPAVVFPFLLGIFCLYAMYLRTALFGRRDAVYYGSSHPEVPGYPLFMNLSAAPEPVRKRMWRERKVWIYLLVVLAVFLGLFAWCLNARQELRCDGSLRIYSGREQIKQEYGADELERFTVRISAPYSGRYDSQEFHELDFMVRYENGQYFTFEMSDRTGDLQEYIRQLLVLKGQVGDEVFRAEDEELLAELIRDQKLRGEEARMLYELFALSEK